MTNSYKELLKQREALEQAIASARQQELSEGVRKARELVAEFGLTVQDIFPSGRGTSKSSGNQQVVKLPLNTVIQQQVKLGLAAVRRLNGLTGKTVLSF